MSIKLGDNIEMTGPVPNDARYLNVNVPWTSTTEVNSALLGGTGGVRYTGLTVNINNTEYWYKDGIADIDLVEKTSGGGGAGMLNWTGSTANAIGTYISASGICAQPNLTFDGNILGLAGNVALKTGGHRCITWNSTSTANGSCLYICGNNAAATSTGGKICIIGGQGGSTSGNGGCAYLYGGCSTSGNGGSVGIWGGNSNNGFGGGVNVRAGASTNANGNQVSIVGGDSQGTDYYGGHVFIAGGENQSLTCTAGNITIVGGGNLNENGPGGNIYICGGGNEGDGVGNVILETTCINVTAPSGMTYNADYSTANETNPRWIPDAGWVTGQTGGGGDVSKVGTPLVCQVGVWTGDGTICGGSSLRMSSNRLCVTGSIGATTNISASGQISGGNLYSSGTIAMENNQKLIFDEDVDQFAYIQADWNGSLGWDSETLVLAAPNNGFYFTCGDDNTLAPICAGAVNIGGGDDINLYAADGTCDSGDIVFRSGGTTSNEWSRIWVDTVGSFNFRSAPDGLIQRCVYHTGNISTATVGTATNATCLGGSLANTYAKLASPTFTGTLTAPTICATTCFKGSGAGLTGTAASLTAGKATIVTTFTGTYPMVVNVTGALYSNTSVTLNGSTGAINATCFVGSGAALTGTASSLTVGTATNATNATNATCLNGQVSGYYARCTVANTFTGKLSLTYAAASEATLKVLRAIDDGSNTPALIVANDGEPTDVIAEFRGNTSGVSVDTSDAPNSADAQFQICGTGIVCAKTHFIAPTICATGNVYGTCFCGKAYDADRLDGASAGSFLRSDAADQKTSGDLRFNDNVAATFGTSNDLKICHDGSGSYIDETGTGAFYIRNAGTNQFYLASTCVQLYNAGVAKFKTCTNGTRTEGIHCATTCLRSALLCITGSAGNHILMAAACGTAIDWTATSDCRIKKCVEPITSALSKVDALCGVCYELCEDDTKDMGLIAQEVEKVEPRLVVHNEVDNVYEKYGIEDEMLGLKYDKFAGLFVEAIKELKVQNNNQQLQIEKLKSELKTLKDEKSI